MMYTIAETISIHQKSVSTRCDCGPAGSVALCEPAQPEMTAASTANAAACVVRRGGRTASGVPLPRAESREPRAVMA